MIVNAEIIQLMTVTRFYVILHKRESTAQKMIM